MSSRIALHPRCVIATCVALAFGLCLFAAQVSAQAPQPKDELFVGYSWLHTGGYVDFGYKSPDIQDGFDISNVYYLPQAHNLGFLIDGSYHWNGTIPHVVNDLHVGTILAGLQYKYHTNTLSPFVRIFAGGVEHGSAKYNISKWSAGAGVGGGLDLRVSDHFTIRLAQADYIYNNYTPKIYIAHSNQWNSVRLAAGLELTLGNYYAPPLSCSATASPAEVWSGDPVKVSTTGTNFNPKHALGYAWTANGGKLSDANTQTATVDTTGMAPGSYSSSVTITDTRMKKNNTATCAANFSIRQPQPPQVSCSANPTTIAIGESSTITMTATDPQGWPMTYSWSATGGQLSGTGTTATLTATNADAGTTITVTGTASDARANLSANCTASVTVPPVVKCVSIEDWGECTFEKNPKKPWRVDNDCKDTLDKLALRLQQMPNGKVDIVGYTDEKESVNVKTKTLGAQRAVNVKYYLTSDGPTKIDAGRIQPREGATKGKATHFYFVPEGTMCEGQVEEGTAVDESQVQPQSRNAPAKKKAHKAKPAAPPAQ